MPQESISRSIGTATCSSHGSMRARLTTPLRAGVWRWHRRPPACQRGAPARLPNGAGRHANAVYQFRVGAAFPARAASALYLSAAGGCSLSHAVLPLRAEWSEILRGCCAWEGEPDCFAVYELLVQVLRELTRSFRGGTEKDGEDARLFQTALRYLHEHYSEPLSAGQLASAAAVNRTMLSVLFKKYTGMTPTRYRNEYRLYMAKSMIGRHGPADHRDLRRNGLQSAQPLYRAVSPGAMAPHRFNTASGMVRGDRDVC